MHLSYIFSFFTQLIKSVLEELFTDKDIKENLMPVHLNGMYVCLLFNERCNDTIKSRSKNCLFKDVEAEILL